MPFSAPQASPLWCALDTKATPTAQTTKTQNDAAPAAPSSPKTPVQSMMPSTGFLNGSNGKVILPPTPIGGPATVARKTKRDKRMNEIFQRHEARLRSLGWTSQEGGPPLSPHAQQCRASSKANPKKTRNEKQKRQHRGGSKLTNGTAVRPAPSASVSTLAVPAETETQEEEPTEDMAAPVKPPRRSKTPSEERSASSSTLAVSSPAHAPTSFYYLYLCHKSFFSFIIL